MARRSRRILRLLVALVIAAAVFGGAAYAFTARGGVHGTLADARSGLPVAGARIVYGDRVLFRFASTPFSIGGSGGDLPVTAPGYDDLTVPAAEIGRAPLDLRMEPRTIPGLASIAAWLRQTADGIIIDVQLRSEAGAALEYFPAVPLPARILLAEDIGAEGAPVTGPALFEGRVEGLIDPAARFDKLKYRLPVTLRAGARLLLDLAVEAPGGTLSFRRGGLTPAEAPAS